MNYETKVYIGLDVHVKNTQYAVKDVKSALESYLHSCIVGMEACTSFYPLREGFIHDNVNVKIANVLRIRQLIVKNDSLDARRLSDMLRLKRTLQNSHKCSFCK